MKRLIVLVLVALAITGAIGLSASDTPYTHRLLQLEAAQAVPRFADVLADEPPAVNAVFLDYAGDEALVLNARLALLAYPQASRRVVAIYGTEPEFKQILVRHGASVIPPIVYFLDNDIRALRLMRAAGEAFRDASDAAVRLWKGQPAPVAAEEGETPPITPVERGWYAVNFIRDEGHDFLGQFAMTEDGEAQWVQTERALEGASAFFTSGIRRLETKVRTDQALATEDIAWAGVDVLAVAGAVKALRIGKSTARAASVSARSRRATVIGAALARTGRIGRSTVKFGTAPALLYAAVKHPSLISNLAAGAARLLGWPIWTMQGVVWFALVLPILYLGSLVLRYLVRPMLAVLRGFMAVLS